MTTRTFACFLLLACAPSAALAQVTFTKVTTGPVVTNLATSFGAAWADFDGDGDLDLFVCNGDGANLLFRNDGQGIFTQITDGPLVNAGPGSFSAACADFDNDGRIDVFIGRRPGPGLLFHQEANGTFTQRILGSSAAYGAAWADYDKDGWLDLLVAYASLAVRWHNNGLGSLLSVPSTPIDVSGDTVAWADYDRDGDMDVVVGESSLTGGGNIRLYRNDGSGAFTQITTGQLVQSGTLVTGMAWGDYDNDGFPDLFLARGTSTQALPSFLFHNNTDGTFTQVEQSPFTDDVGFALSCSWADYDNDGWLDLFVTEYNSAQNRLYHNNRDGTFTRVLSGPFASDIGPCAGNCWGDYDRDGFLDLFVSVVSGASYLYHNEGNTNGWITVKCVGTVSNRSAIGAKVRVKATIGNKSFTQLREINTGDGWAGNPLEAHFGLGDATHIETLRIEWPSGTVQEFQNVATNQLLTMTEPAQLQASLASGTPRFTLQGGCNLRYDVEVSPDLVTWSTLATLTITNLNGTALITDTNTPSSGRHFYRAVLR